MTISSCYCGHAKAYQDCCGLYLEQGLLAPDPESLMRSRYTAFCLNHLEYLKKTWHPETYPEDLGAEDPVQWIKLEVIHSEYAEAEGEVEFRASFIYDGKLEILHELSFFDHIDGQWLYHSGDFLDDSPKARKISPQAECPCGSGKLFKQCHASK